MISLVRVSDGWLVSYLRDNEKMNRKFTVIEPAADFMIELGVDTDEIDDALIALYTETSLRRANFNKDGKLFSTDII